MSSSSTSPAESSNKVETKGIDTINRDSDDDYDLKQVLPIERSRSKPVNLYRSKSDDLCKRRAKKVWTVSTREKKKEDEPKSKPKPVEEDKVGDIVRFGRNSYFVVDIFEKEIMELGDKVDLNFKKFKKFEAVDGCCPWDHHFLNYRCCFSSCCCVCSISGVEREWGKLEKELEKKRDGLGFFVRTYKERKELMRVAVTDPSHSVFFFDVKFPTDYPYQAPSLFYHPYGLPFSNFESQKLLKPELYYNILDVFHHIEEIVTMNTNKSCDQMLDMLKRPLNGFEDFVKGHFRKKGAFILRDMMEEMDLEKERDRNSFFKAYVAFEDNKCYCEHLLNSELKEELERYKEKECSLRDHYYSSSSYFPTIISRFDDIQKTPRYRNFLNKIFLL